MTNEHERTLRMKKEYKTLHDQGYTPKEIADKFHLSDTTVYKSLQEIAENEGVTRDSLLVFPHNTPAAYDRKFVPVKPLDISELIANTQETITRAKEVSNAIDTYLSEQELEENA